MTLARMLVIIGRLWGKKYYFTVGKKELHYDTLEKILDIPIEVECHNFCVTFGKKRKKV